jgi:hypothetical protein
VLDEMLDLDGLSVLLRFVLSLKSVILLRGTTTPPLLDDFDKESTLDDFDDSSRLDLRNVLVCETKKDKFIFSFNVLEM